MEPQQHSVEFFNSFIENLQNLCQMYLSYEHMVEVTGYISVEMDNTRKERYLLSEILHTTGSVLSESFCTKVINNSSFSQPCLNTYPNRPVLKQIQTVEGQLAHVEGTKLRTFPRRERKLTAFDEDEPELVAVEMPAKKRRVSNSENRSSERHHHPDRSETGVAETSYLNQNSCQTNNAIREQGEQTSFGSTDCEQFCSPEPELHKTSESGTECRSSIVSASKETTGRSWHVTKLEFPSESTSSQHSKFIHSNKTDSVSPDGVSPHSPRTVPTSASNEYVSSVCQPESQPVELSDAAPPENSGISPSPDSNVMYKLEPGTDVSQDILVYTDIDNDDQTPCQQSTDASQASYGNDDSDRDPIMIELDSDDEEDLVDHDSVTDASSTTPSGQRDLSSFSKPQQFAINRLNQFLKIKKIPGPLCSIPPEKLDSILAEFYQRVRKCGGQEFGSRSLKTIQQYLEIYFRSNNYPASITKSPEFQHSRDVMNAKVKQLKSHEEISLTLKREDVDQLYDCGLLGDSSPEAIINTLWLMNTVKLNIKGCKRHADLKWGDINLETNSDGTEVLLYAGCNLYVLPNDADPSRCFIDLYKKYWSLRPQDVLEADSPFYLAPHETGFRSQKYGSRIGSLLKRMLMSAGLPQEMKILNYDIL